ncbi:aldehyde dehydrogenase family protein [Acetobacter musti]|uniref:Aldehyde dehydrogenase family protein n=1 Tax=Acetobacter musti TaxID=864732 RepID=A0ABX0JU56_9PROT|nr:aldehyde dehydrogenase (NADP(+)) [Acetobacter musti]NHN86774.1 aldehyde dehydrogenase family protein [Acetobacter musti]
MTLTGELIIGNQDVSRETTFHARAAATGEVLPVAFSCATSDDVRKACSLADTAFDSYRATSLGMRAAFLEAAAEEFGAVGDVLCERAHLESGLPMARLIGEAGRTVGQLKMFARLLRDGRCVGSLVDPALPDRSPSPRPDLRQTGIGVGPVAVFGASNFPLAFSIAGGDTASALAAGCPVVARAHPAHPGTGELAGRAIQRAVVRCGLPEGVFSLLGGPDLTVGRELVRNSLIMAVGFTGSRQGGLALMREAASRPVPIPVYAEMSSINPVLLLPAALGARAEALGAAFVMSMSMGAGQFCTSPGLILAIESEGFQRFRSAAVEALAGVAPQTMLTAGIHDAYLAGVRSVAGRPGVTLLGRGPDAGPHECHSALFAADAQIFLEDPTLSHEIFGSCSLIVSCADEAALFAVLRSLEGQLTATLHLDEPDTGLARRLMPVLERKAGRILANGWPTGVEVCDAMVHGGPFPATSDPRTTSVGAKAIERFLRPVCYQDLPAALLPGVLAEF